MFASLSGGTIYVRIYTNRMRLRRAESGDEVDLNATEAFSHQRSVIGDFAAADKLLKSGMKSLKKLTRPIAVMHAIELAEGGLTALEHRALSELALGAGASKVIVWEGTELSDDEVILLHKAEEQKTA